MDRKIPIFLSLLVVLISGCKKNNSTEPTQNVLIHSERMIPVGGGTFADDSISVTISGFWIDKYEVTFELWTEVRTWAATQGYTDLAIGQSGQFSTSANNPVTKVNWYDIVKWCNARSEKDGLKPVYYTRVEQDTIYRRGNLDINISAVNWNANGYRLPTEAEWEFAAHGGTRTHGYILSGSNNPDSVAWYNNNSGTMTHIVGTKSANELGIYDMSGNVWELCWDWFDDWNTYPSGGNFDPKGPATSRTYRIVRGGAFHLNENVCSVRNRNYGLPIESYPDLGFRCVQK